MKSNRCLLLAVVLSALAGGAHPASPQVEGITTTKLRENLYLFTTDQGAYTTNSLAFVGDDGLLLVDTQARGADAAAMKEAVDALGYGDPKYIILTHRHVEHIGGNALYGGDPVVIGHALLPRKLRSGAFLFDEWGPETFPDITVADSLTLFINDEEIRLIDMGGSHDDNELAVHFMKAKVVHLSSVVNGFNFPSVDADGDPLRFPELVARAMRLFPEDVTVVSGHNPPGAWSEFADYRAMHIQAQERVRAALREGKTLPEMQEMDLLSEWDHYAGSYVSADEWIEYLVDGFSEKPEPRPTPHEILYDTWKTGGAQAAVDQYFQIRRDRGQDFSVDEFTLLAIGSRLVENNHPEDGLAFLEGSLRDFPESSVGYYTHYLLGDVYHRLGNDSAALEHCHRALDLQPGFAAAVTLLETITSGG